MSINSFKPAIWSARLLSNLRKTLVYGQEGVANRNYEGEISQFGNQVKIHSIGAIVVFDYTSNADMAAPQDLTEAEILLTVDQQKGFNFQVDDVDQVQSKPKVMDEAMQEAAFALRNVADQHLAQSYLDVQSRNTIGSEASPVALTADNAYDYLVDLNTLLDESNVPEDDRWAIVPPFFRGLLRKDSRFTHSTPTGDSVLRNGQIGMVASLRVLVSNNVPNTAGSAFKILAGHPMAISFAEQIVKVEAYRPERRFADAVKGLHVYGKKTVRPAALALLVGDK